jgi:hypothetical protein
VNAIERNARVVNQTAGRSAVLFAVLHAVFFIGSLIVVPILAPGAKIPNPFGPADASRNFFLNNTEAIRVSAFLQLASAVSLAALGATISSVYKAGRGTSVASALTLLGSIGAAILLAMAALCSWALASPGAVDPGSTFHVLQFLPFLMGGPGWAGFFALFLAGIALGAVSVLPTWAVWAGYFLSFVSALATLVMLTISAAVCLPIGRFLGFFWLIFAAIYVNRSVERAS